MTEKLIDPLHTLENANQITDILAAIEQVEKARTFASSVVIGCSANVTIDQLEIPIKKHAYLNQKKANIVMGAFDSHLENIEAFKREKVEYAVFWNFFDALIQSFEARFSSISSNMLQDIRERTLAQYQLILNSASSFKAVVIPLFHRMNPAPLVSSGDQVDLFVQELNSEIRKLSHNFNNVILMDTQAIMDQIGQENSFNTRFYFKFTAPYALGFFDVFARNLGLASRGFGSYFYKALVLDCDNTLWGGIIGEDLLTGIKLGPHDYPGNIYWTIQNEILNLKKQGVLLVLCSKNNPSDVDEVLQKHEFMAFRDADVILKKVNWTDKAQNLKEIAAELNIGLDSLVFLDDSEFECNAVRLQLPMVNTIQVPKNIFDYPKVFRKVKELFLGAASQKAEVDKTEQYRIRALAIQEQNKFANQDEYLASLGIKVKLRLNHQPSAPRVSELSQKSNQFNVTTRRYTVQEIFGLMNSADAAVYTMEVSDKFGDSGLTGIAVVKFNGTELFVDSFLMSCRIIGRGIEFSVWKSIFDDAIRKGCREVNAEFIRTPKNALVEKFFDDLGLLVVRGDENHKIYQSKIEIFKSMDRPHVEVNYELG